MVWLLSLPRVVEIRQNGSEQKPHQRHATQIPYPPLVIAALLWFLLGEPGSHALAEFSIVVRRASNVVHSFSNVVRSFSNVVRSFLVLPERQEVAHSQLVLP